MKRFLLISLLALLAGNLSAAEQFRVAWSHYTGWEPWDYAEQSGILRKWADQEGIEIELTLVNDYIESINLYTAGEFDACTMTNMDALTIPAAGGIDSTALIVGDFSNGNDGIVIKNGDSVKDLKGRTINLVELSVSHYMLARALEMNGLSERDLKPLNTSDADIAALFASDPNGAVATWNPPLQQVKKAPGAKLVFDSSQIPGEIIDLLVVRSDAPDTLKRALAGAWYEVMDVMSGDHAEARQAIAMMAETAGAGEAEFRDQLKTTAMFYDADEAAEFARGDQLKETMEHVRQFSFDKGLFGAGADSPDYVGIAFPDGSVIGDESNVKLRFNADFMEAAAE